VDGASEQRGDSSFSHRFCGAKSQVFISNLAALHSSSLSLI